MKEQEVKEKKEKRSLLEIVKGLLGGDRASAVPAVAEPAPEVVERLVERAVSGKSDLSDESDRSDESDLSDLSDESDEAKTDGSEKSDKSDSSDSSDKSDKSCSYAMKRAIVESLQEVRRFAEEHHLANAVVKALLTLLVEIALDAMKGKVSGRVLEILLKAFNYDSDKKAAYRQGEKDGRNATIRLDVFPESEDPSVLPVMNGHVRKTKEHKTIFDIAQGS